MASILAEGAALAAEAPETFSAVGEAVGEASNAGSKVWNAAKGAWEYTKSVVTNPAVYLPALGTYLLNEHKVNQSIKDTYNYATQGLSDVSDVYGYAKQGVDDVEDAYNSLHQYLSGTVHQRSSIQQDGNPTFQNGNHGINYTLDNSMTNASEYTRPIVNDIEPPPSLTQQQPTAAIPGGFTSSSYGYGEY